MTKEELQKIREEWISDIWEYHEDELKEAFGEEFEEGDITASQLLDLDMNRREDLAYMAGYLYRLKEEMEEMNEC